MSRRSRATCPTCHDHGTYQRRDETRTCTCLAGLQHNLNHLASLTDDLETTLARQGASGGRVGSRSSERLLPFDTGAGLVLAELRRMLVGWVTELAVTNPHQGATCARERCRHPSCQVIRADVFPRADIAAMAGWLLRMFPRLRVYPQVEELAADVHRHVDAAKRVIDRAADRWYAGPCRTPGCTDVRGTERPTDLYAVVDARQVRCRRCGASYDVAEQRRWLLAQAEDRLATATECARALTSLGQPVTADRIRKWKERGLLAAHGRELSADGKEHPTYRVGDVIDRLASDRAKEAHRAS